MGVTKNYTRVDLIRWSVWFFFINAFIAGLVIFGYLPNISQLKTVHDATISRSMFGFFFFIFAFFAQTSLAMLVCLLFTWLISLVTGRRSITLLLGSIFSAVIIGVLIADAITFRLYHMHYFAIGWRIIQSGTLNDVLALDLKEWAAIIIVFGLIILLELLLAFWIWRIVFKYKLKTISVLLSMLTSVFVVYTFFGFAIADRMWSDGYRYVVLRIGRVVPYLSQIYLAFLKPQSQMQIINLNGKKTPVVVQDLKIPIHYSIDDPQYGLADKNIVIIGIDAWRYSSFSKKVTPNIYTFAKQAIQFNQHYSSGNSTQPGLFGLFYGIAPTYWQSFLKYRQSPIFIDALLKQGYQMGVFLSAPLTFPRFNNTIFVKLHQLRSRTPGDSSMARDKRITQDFTKFIKTLPKGKHFFSFLFYDAIHNYCESARPNKILFRPQVASCNRLSLDKDSDPIPYLNLYNNKAHFIDSLIGQVLLALKTHHHLADTVVIITSDHGEQMNDQKRGIWGHASAYNTEQLHVPLIVYWPGKKPKQVTYQTTHYDIVPTLMRLVLKVGSKFPNIVEHSLFSPNQGDYFIAGSYGDYAILTPNKILRIYPDGDYAITNRDGDVQNKTDFDLGVLKRAEYSLLNFYKK